MSAARRKGNALELEVARRLHALDGRDARLAALETDGGRLGWAYAAQIDVATTRLVCECKSREDNPARLWTWLDGLTNAAMRLGAKLGDPEPKYPILVLRRNRRRPLVVLDMELFESMFDAAIAYDAALADPAESYELGAAVMDDYQLSERGEA